jgi:hypothetical protein
MTTVTLYGTAVEYGHTEKVFDRIENKLETSAEKALIEYFKNLVTEVKRAFSDELTNYKFDSYHDFELKLYAALAKARDVLQRNKNTLPEHRYLFWNIWSYGEPTDKYQGIEVPIAVIEITEDGWIYEIETSIIVAYNHSKKIAVIDTDEVWYYKYIATTQESLSDEGVRRYVAKWLFSNAAFGTVHIKVPILGCVE